MDIQELPPFCAIGWHDYHETGNGWSCSQCDYFIPHGCEPWIEREEEENDDNGAEQQDRMDR